MSQTSPPEQQSQGLKPRRSLIFVRIVRKLSGLARLGVFVVRSAWMLNLTKYGLVCIVVAFATTAASAQLNVGDPAPTIQVSDWIKGDPVDLAKGKGSKAYLVEFWATWCGPCIESMPHLSELQRKHRKNGLVVVGVATPGRGETLKVVKRFVKRRGSSIDYTIGFDESGETQKRYMYAVGAGGIPYAFLIDKSGTLVWHGHPGDPAMDMIIDDVVHGRFDVREAEVRERLDPLFARMHQYASRGNWDGFKGLLAEALDLDPASDRAMSAAVYVYLIENDDVAGLRALIESHMDKHRNEPDVMAVVANALLEIQDLDKRLPDLAVTAAGAANRLSKTKNAFMLSTYARALFQIGLVDRAIEMQNNAVASANDDSERTVQERVLKYYKTCKSLHSERL
jgi:thiol-disulfide isomerase/thioredoxin